MEQSGFEARTLEFDDKRTESLPPKNRFAGRLSSLKKLEECVVGFLLRRINEVGEDETGRTVRV